ncbi:MAG: glycosyltransferase, partial [Infirmifilum sp.]
VVKVPAIVEDEVVGESGPLRASRLDRGMFRWLSYLADRYVMAKANAVAVPSPLMFVQLAKSRRISTRNILIIPAAISLKKVQKARQAIELENRRNFKEFTLGFVGILAWWQGVEALVRAVHKLQSTGLACRLVIVGDGPQRKAVEELCRTLNVNCLITGFIPHEEALKLMSQFDVLVLPRERTSTTESVVPLKVIEAWALGVPVVVTRHKIFELLGLRDGEDVVYCEPTPESVAQAVRRVLESEHLRDKLRRRGPQLAERFDYDTIAKRLLNTS